MGRVLAHKFIQQEHCERKPYSIHRKFSAIAGGKLLDANREPTAAAARRAIANHISEKGHESHAKCKGLSTKHEGRWDSMWMVKWFEWYRYVVVFSRKAFDITVSSAKGISETLRAENAKTAWSS